MVLPLLVSSIWVASRFPLASRQNCRKPGSTTTQPRFTITTVTSGTTAATGKGFAIGSAALTALALLASYIEEIKIGLQHVGTAVLQVGEIRLRLVSGDKGEKGSGYVAFYVDEEDFEDALEEVDEAELEVVSGPESIKGGKRIIIADPDGNRIALCSSAK